MEKRVVVKYDKYRNSLVPVNIRHAEAVKVLNHEGIYAVLSEENLDSLRLKLEGHPQSRSYKLVQELLEEIKKIKIE